MHIDIVHHIEQTSPLPKLHFSKEEEQATDSQIESLLAKGAIVKSQHKLREYISNVFLCPKRDGGFQMILNLKEFNKHVNYNKFTMESLQQILELVEPFCFMTSMDFDSSFLTCPVHPDHQKFLKFLWKGQMYKYI